MDEVTYTWFNRLIALKFMEINGCLPDQIKVFTSADPNKPEPDLLTNALKLDFLDLDRNSVLDLKAENKDEELYKDLILKLCNYLNKIMPFLFEKIEDYTELLFPDKLLHTGSVLHDLNSIIPDEDWHEVEIIGWIYQDYIAPKKDKVFADLKKNIKISKENIPAVTQLFTPHWIVRYLVENSLGRLWMLNRPESSLVDRMEYYIKPEQQETDFLKINSPEELKICDPACGSGHMLVYAFDLLYSIYEEEGYTPSEIPGMILTHNLFGIEIDKRAGELAGFALTMKARGKDRRFFRNPVQPNICMLENVAFEEGELNDYINAVGKDLFSNAHRDTLLQFAEADNFGSLIRPAATDVSDLLHLLESKNLSGNLSHFSTHQKVLQALKQADYLSPKYHVIITNPPYMGNKGMNSKLRTFAQDNYPDSKSDLFAMFIERFVGTVSSGFIGLMTPFTWMFLSSYEKLRSLILNENTLTNLVRPEYHAFFESAYVPICGFTLFTRSQPEYKGAFIDLSKFYGADLQPIKTLEAIQNPNSGWFYRASAADFKKIPRSPIAYWASEKTLHVFANKKLNKILKPKAGITTGNNDKFLRYWFELSRERFVTKNKCKESEEDIFVPHMKGGDFRKWYGNFEYTLKYGRNAISEMKKEKGFRPDGFDFFFKPLIAWSKITAGNFSARWVDGGASFDSTGTCGYSPDYQ